MRRVTVDQIREALNACNGNMVRAARVLGLARNNLYKRLANSGIRPGDFRGNSAPPVTATAAAHATCGAAKHGPTGLAAPVAPVPVSRSAIYPGAAVARTFHHVSSAAMNPPPPEEPKQLRLSRSIYLRPEQIRALDDACLDLPRVLREKLSPSKVLEKFIDERFEEWLGSKLSQENPPESRGKRRAKGGIE